MCVRGQGLSDHWTTWTLRTTFYGHFKSAKMKGRPITLEEFERMLAKTEATLCKPVPQSGPSGVRCDAGQRLRGLHMLYGRIGSRLRRMGVVEQ